jgi:hypothetical protein
MEFAIEKKIPLPNRKTTWVTLVASMGVGDSVVIPVLHRGSLTTAIFRAGFKPVTKKAETAGFVRVWKTQP